MSQPAILSSYDPGLHNADLEQSFSRLSEEGAYKDLSSIIISPAIHPIHPRIVGPWMGLMRPPNNRTVHMMPVALEVGEAYSRTIEAILGHPDLGQWKYVVTLECDNAPPQDGLMSLLRQMEARPEFAAIGGLYWTKGRGAAAQIWGDPHEFPMSFRPQRPDPGGGLVECNGLGMGFTCFRLSLFRDERLRRPWFKTVASREEGVGTQDLWFAADARKHGYRFAVDCSIRVGHFDGEVMW